MNSRMEDLVTYNTFNQMLAGQFPVTNSDKKPHTKATICSMYWEADTMGCIKEARAINKLFSESFGYRTKEFAIPSNKSYFAVLDEVSRLTQDHGESTLLIIYYGGHADTDAENGRFGSIWTAHQEGGPSLPWDQIQSMVLDSKDTEADILLILDCCYAAQAARSRVKSRKFHLLSAAAKGRQTPGVGETSFTTVLIRQMKQLLNRKGFVSIPELYRELTRREALLTETPFQVDMLPYENSTPLNLRPLLPLSRESSFSAGYPEEGSAFVTLRLTLPHGLDPSSSSTITEWLTTTAPSIIGDVQCIEVTYPPENLTSPAILVNHPELAATPYTIIESPRSTKRISRTTPPPDDQVFVLVWPEDSLVSPKKL